MVCLTRDTFGFAMKSTYCVIDGKKYTIQKNPKTDKNNLKKSHKGLCCVVKEENKFVCHDGYAEDTMPEENELKLVFKDGELVKEQTFEEIRERLNGENHDEIIEGNLFDTDAKFICHQVNCMGKMGSGVALQVRQRFPHVYEEYKR